MTLQRALLKAKQGKKETG